MYLRRCSDAVLACRVRCSQVQCRKPKSRQQEVQLYYEDYPHCPSSYIVYQCCTTTKYIELSWILRSSLLNSVGFHALFYWAEVDSVHFFTELRWIPRSSLLSWGGFRALLYWAEVDSTLFFTELRWIPRSSLLSWGGFRALLYWAQLDSAHFLTQLSP